VLIRGLKKPRVQRWFSTGEALLLARSRAHANGSGILKARGIFQEGTERKAPQDRSIHFSYHGRLHRFRPAGQKDGRGGRKAASTGEAPFPKRSTFEQNETKLLMPSRPSDDLGQRNYNFLHPAGGIPRL